jgi:carbon monoxide dehydrogenase subunit G
MPRFSVSQKIAAPLEEVFALFSDFHHVAGRIPAITKLEVLTPGPIGVGTRFRETRMMFKREATEEMEITAFTPGKSYEISCQSCGAMYCSLFRFEPENGGTRVSVDFTTRAVSWLAWLMAPLSRLMMPMMKKCVLQDIEGMKKVAEQGPKVIQEAS